MYENVRRGLMLSYQKIVQLISEPLLKKRFNNVMLRMY